MIRRDEGTEVLRSPEGSERMDFPLGTQHLIRADRKNNGYDPHSQKEE